MEQSATNFLLLTSVIEKVGKMSYRDFVKKYQIDYLGLQQIYFGEDLVQVKQEDVAESKSQNTELFKKDKAYISPAETSTGYIESDGNTGESERNQSGGNERLFRICGRRQRI